MDRYRITLEFNADSNPANWDWANLLSEIGEFVELVKVEQPEEDKEQNV